jgi:thymidylate synthase ThyX
MNKKELFKYMKIKKGEIPRTRFISYPDSVKVTLLDYPDIKRIKEVFVNFSTGSWYPNYSKTIHKKDVDKEMKDLLSGKTLGQGIETAQFTFLVEGITLHDSHALVRNRIGITYMQQSQAVRDLRHDDVLVPRSYTKYPKLLRKYKTWIIDSKYLYSDLLDTGNISVNDARLSLTKTIPVWIYFSCNLMTLISLLSKRLDSQEESIGLNEMSKQIVKLVTKKFPFLKEFLKSACEKGKCFHQRRGFKANCIYKRDKLHEIKGYKDEFTLHDKTKEELSKGKKYKIEKYIGYKKQ